MKARLTFNLPDEQHDFDVAIQGSKMYSALWDISQELRRLWKYEELSEEQFEMVERIRDSFHSILQEHNVNLNK